MNPNTSARWMLIHGMATAICSDSSVSFASPEYQAATKVKDIVESMVSDAAKKISALEAEVKTLKAHLSGGKVE